jgi:hypothetical protein
MQSKEILDEAIARIGGAFDDFQLRACRESRDGILTLRGTGREVGNPPRPAITCAITRRASASRMSTPFARKCDARSSGSKPKIFITR